MPGASTSTVSVGFYNRILSIVPSATIGTDTFDIGVIGIDDGIVYSMPIPTPYSKSLLGIQASVSGVINFTLQSTLDPIQEPQDCAVLTWINTPDTAFVNRTTSGQTNYGVAAPVALRVVVNSATDGSLLLDIAPSDRAR
jgi:hypothetical protein